MPRSHGRSPATLRDRAGFALPLALIGLVTVSLVLTAALMTSSTEVALSLAQQDGARGLYRADAVLESYVAQRAVAAPGDQRLVPGTAAFQPAGGPPFSMQVARLAMGPTVTQGAVMSRQETYSLVARPANGRGRSVGALLNARRQGEAFQLSVTAGLTSGGNVEVSGNSTVSDGRGSNCDSIQRTSPNALQVTAGSDIKVTGNAARIEGKADTASFHKTQMVELLLGGMSLPQAAQRANIRFAANEFNGRPKSHDAATPRPRTDPYNWGCPTKSTDACTTVPGNQTNRDYHPVVAIDGGGGTVTLEGDHGQGMLIVHNGSLHIRGNFVYNGVILVERDLNILGSSGGGGDGVKIEGAVLALGVSSNVTDNASGNAVIAYNRCTVDDAVSGFNQQLLETAAQVFPTPTFAWFEVIR
jgi:hypothetical protein